MKPLIPVLFLIVFSGIVMAEGEMKTLDFSNSTYLLVQMGAHDGVRFDWGGMDNKVVIGNVDVANKRVEVTAFIEGASTPNYAALTQKTSIVYDFERDDVKDLKLSLVKFVDDNTVVILFERLSEPKVVEEEVQSSWAKVTGYFSKWPFSSPSYNIGLLVLVLIVIVLLIGSSRFIRRRYRRMRRSMRLG
jgi:hypothetical protein